MLSKITVVKCIVNHIPCDSRSFPFLSVGLPSDNDDRIRYICVMAPLLLTSSNSRTPNITYLNVNFILALSKKKFNWFFVPLRIQLPNAWQCSDSPSGRGVLYPFFLHSFVAVDAATDGFSPSFSIFKKLRLLMLCWHRCVRWRVEEEKCAFFVHLIGVWWHH